MARGFRCDVCGQSEDAPDKPNLRSFALPAGWFRINGGDENQTFKRECCSVECAMRGIEEIETLRHEASWEAR